MKYRRVVLFEVFVQYKVRNRSILNYWFIPIIHLELIIIKISLNYLHTHIEIYVKCMTINSWCVTIFGTRNQKLNKSCHPEELRKRKQILHQLPNHECRYASEAWLHQFQPLHIYQYELYLLASYGLWNIHTHTIYQSRFV